MNAFELAWYFEGQTALKDVKYATVFAPDMETAKAQFLKSEPKAKFLEKLCKNLTA